MGPLGTVERRGDVNSTGYPFNCLRDPQDVVFEVESHLLPKTGLGYHGAAHR
jgi:hypothetical protein